MVVAVSAVFKAIADSGYEGYIGHEFVPKGSDVLSALRAAYELWPESRKVREAYAHFLSSRGRANEARAVLDAAP